MLKPFFALLLVLAALSGGIYAFHGAKASRRPKTEDASLLLRRYQQYFSAPPTSTPTPRGSAFVSPRIFGVALAAMLFGSAYLGLGHTLEADAGPTTPAPMTINTVSQHDELRPATWHSEAELAKLLTSAQLTPPAAGSVAEAVLAAPPPVEPPAPPAAPEPEPAPQPEPAAAAYVPPSFPEGGFEAIICSMPWPCAEAIAVASCESGRDRNGLLDGNWATNGNHFGLFQISHIHAWRWADFYDAWMDPTRNVQYAFEIWSESGWRPWSCRPS